MKKLENKHIGEIIGVTDDFIVVSHSKYDVNVDINQVMDFNDKGKNIQFPRIIQPNKFKVLDVRQEGLDG